MSMVGLTRVASVVEAPSHLEFVSSFFINSESDHGEESGCGGANREARECKPNKQNRNPGVETVEARRRNFPSPEKSQKRMPGILLTESTQLPERAGACSRECLT